MTDKTKQECYDGNVLPVVQMGHPILLERAKEVLPEHVSTAHIQRLIKDMRETMLAAPGIGIAAPQVGESLRIIVFRIPPGKEKGCLEGVPPTALINPGYEKVGDEMVKDWEGCLSVKGKRGRVPRYERIRYWGLTEKGVRVERTADGWLSRIVQHECDHLNGILYPQLVEEDDIIEEAWRSPLLLPEPETVVSN